MNTNDVTDDILDDLKQATSEAEDAARGALGSDRMRTARAKLNSAIDTAKSTYYKIEDKAVAGAKATDRSIREHPYQAVGVAFAVGILLGFVLTRNNKR